MGRTRCPSCGAAVRTDAPWCLLCHHDLRRVAQAPPEPASQPPLASVDAAAAPLDRPVAAVGARATVAPTWPCTVCGAGNALAAPACTACGAAFLAPLRRDAEPGWRLPVLGDVSRLSRNARLALAAGVGLVAALVLSGIVLAVGSLL